MFAGRLSKFSDFFQSHKLSSLYVVCADEVRDGMKRNFQNEKAVFHREWERRERDLEKERVIEKRRGERERERGMNNNVL